jgi:hypothetical protein
MSCYLPDRRALENRRYVGKLARSLPRQAVLSGVMMHLAFDRRWITAAIPDAQMTVVRLRSTDETLIARLDQREIGLGRDEQVQRALQQARRMASEPPEGVLFVPTDGKSPSELAETLLHEIGWLRRQ